MDYLTSQKHKDIITHFNDLYNVKRKRLEDALKETATHFYLREKYVYKLIFYIPDNFEFYNNLTDANIKKELQTY